MLPQKLKRAVADNPKKVADLIDLHNLPSTLREFLGQSQSSPLSCFIRVWSYIKTNNLQGNICASGVVLGGHKYPDNLLDILYKLREEPLPEEMFSNMNHLFVWDPNDKNVVKCDDKLKSILLGKSKVELAELPYLVKLHFPKKSKYLKMGRVENEH